MMKMMIMSAGNPKVSQPRAQRGNFMPVPASASARKLSQPQPLRYTQHTTYSRLPKGSRLVDTMKSSMD